MAKKYTRPTYDHPLKKAIKERGYTYDEFADLCGISRDTILNIVGRKTGSTGRYNHRHNNRVVDSIAFGLKISYKEAEEMVNGLPKI